ncbi:hypothetical protein KIW84_061776 [Lathyrus oleraceus]|uniref:Copia protein n=1 Tax=Pisum sativum TaxID=3888 RepID=A0A9D4W3B8_PEA|nr:hypothetical protein KIW84_061776 [Pisum sativum]
MAECKPAKTPMHLTCILEKEEVSQKVCQKLYRDPRESHLTTVKRILRYLKGTPNMGLMYEKTSKYRLSVYCDADYAGDRMERKSTSGNYQLLGKNLISWASKRQSTIALSTAEAEYISASLCTTQMLWMKNQLEDLQIFESNIRIFCDNTTAICLSKNPILHSRAKHIEIKHHFIRDYVQKGIVTLKFIDTDHQWADIFTKPLAEDRFSFILKNLNIQNCPE